MVAHRKGDAQDRVMEHKQVMQQKKSHFHAELILKHSMEEQNSETRILCDENVA